MISPAQRRMLFGMRRQVRGLEDADLWRAALVWAAGVQSVRDLDRGGVDSVVSHLERLGATNTSPRKKQQIGYRAGMATPQQIGLIRRLWCAWSADGTEAGLGKFLERTAKVSALRFLTAAGASAVIAGLRRMQAPPPAA